MSTSRESAVASFCFNRSIYATNRNPGGIVSEARSNAKSTSEVSVSSPRATDPKTKMWRTPAARKFGLQGAQRSQNVAIDPRGTHT